MHSYLQQHYSAFDYSLKKCCCSPFRAQSRADFLERACSGSSGPFSIGSVFSSQAVGDGVLIFMIQCFSDCVTSQPIKVRALRLLQDISSVSGQLPTSYWLRDVIKTGAVVGWGAEASVWHATHRGSKVVVRQALRTSIDVLPVRCPLLFIFSQHDAYRLSFRSSIERSYLTGSFNTTMSSRWQGSSAMNWGFLQ